jgi:hypothetical protein
MTYGSGDLVQFEASDQRVDVLTRGLRTRQMPLPRIELCLFEGREP